MAGEAIISGVLRGVASKLSSPILNEFWLLWGVAEEKQKLESNLSAIRAALRDAERRQVNEDLVRDWLGKLTLAAYDAEDLLDEFVVEARRREVENQDGMGKKVRNFFSTSNPIAFNWKMAHKMQKMMARFDVLAKEKERYRLEGYVRSEPSISSARETREPASFVNESSVYGRDNEKEKLIDSLIKCGNESVLSIIPIVGMGGLGKTTLAQLVYNDKKSVATHFDLKMWVYVSEVFDVKRLLKQILESAKVKPEQSSIDHLVTSLRDALSGKRYLLVLDDVWNDDPGEFLDKWARLKTWLACGSMGSKVLVTTRDDRVSEIMHTLPAHNLEALSEKDSWDLFEKLANPQQDLPQNLLSIGEEIVSKCGGLPLAVETLGGLMSCKKKEREDWEDVKNSEFWKPQNNIGGGILPSLRLSYDHLTPSLKQCFAYCAVIPKGSRFNKDELIKQWMAQGFIHSDDENELLEEEGTRYFNGLLRRCLFQVGVETASNDEYKMHDLIHDLLRSVAGKECFVVEASMMNDLTRHLASFDDETRHLAVCNEGWEGETKNFDTLKKCKKLRSMIANRVDCRIDINVFLRFKCLRVLDLNLTSIHSLPNSIDKLRHLRYFDISYTSITELPETICNLHNLQTLRVLNVLLQKWPKNMKRMISLRHIEFDGFFYDFPLPKGIGELTFLRTLPEFMIAKESGAQIEELKNLNLLMGNISIKGLEKIRNGACARKADLKAKKHLHSLHLCWNWNRPGYESEEVINNLEPHSNLKKLLVSNYSGLSLPSWMMRLSNLIHIKLRDCIRCEQLPPFGQLPHLESLEIHNMTAIKYIVQFDGSHNNNVIFRSLTLLVLDGLPNLERWSSQQENGDGDERRTGEDEQVILSCLRRFCIRRCPKLIRLPKLVLPALEFLEMDGVGRDRIDLPMSESLKELDLHLERRSSGEVDGDEDDERLLGSLANYTSLVRLGIGGFPEVVHLPKEIGPTHADNLHTLRIANCPKLISLSHHLKYLHSLKELSIDACPNLVLPLLDGSQEQQRFPPLNSLKKLEISASCEKQTSLPGEGMIMTSLEGLIITKCGNLESLSSEGLQNLTFLYIYGCPKVWSSPEWLRNLTSLKALFGVVLNGTTSLTNPLENLKSLEYLSISSGPDMTDFPEWIGNLASLTYLSIHGCPGIRSLPESLGNLLIDSCRDSIELPKGLTNLRHLNIDSCTALTELPKGLQRLTNLRELEIEECPDLERRLQKNWKEWKKVAHVPKITIDYRQLSWEAEHPSLMQSLKKGCNKFDKKLCFPSSASSSSSSP